MRQTVRNNTTRQSHRSHHRPPVAEYESNLHTTAQTGVLITEQEHKLLTKVLEMRRAGHRLVVITGGPGEDARISHGDGCATVSTRPLR